MSELVDLVDPPYIFTGIVRTSSAHYKTQYLSSYKDKKITRMYGNWIKGWFHGTLLIEGTHTDLFVLGARLKKIKPTTQKED